jgi:hypothetical protein
MTDSSRRTHLDELELPAGRDLHGFDLLTVLHLAGGEQRPHLLSGEGTVDLGKPRVGTNST